MKHACPKMEVEIAGVSFKNPVTVASGTFGSGMEYAAYMDLSKLGAVTTKGVSALPWTGNETPRVCETASGMLNAIGLQNPGVDLFLTRDLPFLKQFDTRVIVNVVGHTEEEYLETVRRLRDADCDLLEINISCPNVKEGGIAFGREPKQIEAITRKIKDAARQPVIIKLSPNVADIADCAKAAEAGGADALSLINTLIGMRIDIKRRAFMLANKTGGLSGPAILPVALRMVYEAAQATDLPLIGMGGISSGTDALEFLMAGATMVAVGTASFRDPQAAPRILAELETLLANEGIEDIRSLIGCVH